MALKFYQDSSLTTRIQEILGTQTNGTEIPNIMEEPQEVRFFNNTIVYGELWTKVSTSPSGKQWKYDQNTKRVILGQEISNGVIVAISNGVKLFETVNTVSGLSLFLSNSDRVEDRTKIQQVWIYNDEDTKKYSDIKVNQIQSFISQGAQPSWFTVSDNGNTWTNPPLQIDEIVGNQQKTFYIRCIVPYGTQVENYRNIYLEVRAFEMSLS